jgi:TonB family protein
MYHFDPLLTDSGTYGGSLKRRLLIGSAIAHVVFFIVIAILPSPARSISEPSLPMEIVFTAPVPNVPEFVPPAPAPKPEPPPKKVEPPKAKTPEPLPVPEPPPAPIAEVKPAPAPAPAPPAPKPQPVIKTNVFGGVAEGPPVVTGKGKTGRTVIAAFGDTVGPITSIPRRERVAEVGFDSTPAQAAPRRASGGTVKSAAFDAPAAAAPAPAAPKREAPVAKLEAEVEILSKPKPVYTDDARRLRIEGDIVLKVVFGANGRVTVLGVVEGLGHGLDEAAIAAAKKVEFNPARRDGQPVDHTANLRVVFRLA